MRGRSPDARLGLLLTAAGLGLALGTLVYLTDRVGARSLLVPTVEALAGTHLFGAVGGWLPSLFHPFAFSLLTAATLPPSSAPRYGVCLGWGLVNLVFEVGQHPQLSPPLAEALQAHLGHTWLAQALSSYFSRGTFDPADLVGVVLGTLAAAVVLRLVHRSLETDHAHLAR